MTLAQYIALRGASLVSSPGYRTLKSLEELYLADHEDELAEIAEESFVGDLVGVRHSSDVCVYQSGRESQGTYINLKTKGVLYFRRG